MFACTGGVLVSSLHRFNTSTKMWTLLSNAGSAPSARSGPGLTSMQDGNVYLFGGSVNGISQSHNNLTFHCFLSRPPLCLCLSLSISLSLYLSSLFLSLSHSLSLPLSLSFLPTGRTAVWGNLPSEDVNVVFSTSSPLARSLSCSLSLPLSLALSRTLSRTLFLSLSLSLSLSSPPSFWPPFSIFKTLLLPPPSCFLPSLNPLVCFSHTSARARVLSEPSKLCPPLSRLLYIFSLIFHFSLSPFMPISVECVPVIFIVTFLPPSLPSLPSTMSLRPFVLQFSLVQTHLYSILPFIAFLLPFFRDESQ